MTGNIRTPRPARAAIAAVLALTATPLFAQEVLPPTAPTAAAPTPTPIVPPPVVNAPTAPAAAAPAAVSQATTGAAPTVEFKPSEPVVQSTPPVEERIAAARAASDAESTPAAAPARRTSARRTAAPRPAAEPSTRSAAPAPAVTKAPAEAGPAAPAVAAAEPPASSPATATATPAPAANNDAMLWGIGGGALLLIGIAGAALARRRRRDDVDAVYDEPAVAAEPMPSFAAPAPAVAVARPARTTPVAYSHGDADLAAMVAAPPSAENPFLTRAKRLRRARQLIAQREAAATPMAAPQTTHAEPVAAAPVDRSQTVYRFSGQGASSPGFLKPRTR